MLCRCAEVRPYPYGYIHIHVRGGGRYMWLFQNCRGACLARRSTRIMVRMGGMSERKFISSKMIQVRTRCKRQKYMKTIKPKNGAGMNEAHDRVRLCSVCDWEGDCGLLPSANVSGGAGGVFFLRGGGGFQHSLLRACERRRGDSARACEVVLVGWWCR
jgi:hypothetical protein